MLTTRSLGRNETFSPTASNYGFGGATRGHGSRVVATFGALLVDRRFPQGKYARAFTILISMNFSCKHSFHSGFLHCLRLDRRTSPALGQRGGILGPSGDMIDICSDINLNDRHLPGHQSHPFTNRILGDRWFADSPLFPGRSSAWFHGA